MFQTVVTADLPSQERPGRAPQDESFVMMHDRLSVPPGRLLQMLTQVFEAAGITDATMVLVDEAALYLDNEESDDGDLDQLMTRVQEEGFLDKGFHELLLGLSLWEDGLQHIILARVLTAVPVGEHELTVRICSRPDDWNARRLDDPVRYAKRMHEYTADGETIRHWKERVDAVATRIADSLGRSLFRQDVVRRGARLTIVRPPRANLLETANLTWGDPVVPPHYRLLPLEHRTSGWDDVGNDVYEDPDLTLRNYLFLDALLREEHLRFEWVDVADPNGKVLFSGHKARWFANWPWGKNHRLSMTPEGVVPQLGVQ